MIESVDEEALGEHLEAGEKKERGAYFTPAPLVERVLAAVAPFVPAQGRLRIIDPACGAGAFLHPAAAKWPNAELVGVELNPTSAALCQQRVPRAQIIVGDALTNELLPPRDDAFELWVGNPPWNGTSPLLRSPEAWARACSWLPRGTTLKPGTSLREDYVFFLLKASLRLQERGALAFITSATLLDAYAHAPIREALLSRLTLREVMVLPRGTFAGTRVEPAVTVWTGPTQGTHVPGAEVNLRPHTEAATALDATWKRAGLTLPELVPVSFAGLKTRFDELLVDDDRAVLERRVRAFLETDVEAFAADFGLGDFMPKLAALKVFSKAARFDASRVRPFLRYRGPKPMGAPAWCYVDRQLIPRGDHRLRGTFDPHATNLKLVFNMNELPLAAHVLDTPGCVTMYRHSRFAPAMVPRGLLEDWNAKDFDAEDLVPNLTDRAAKLGDARTVFEHIARHVMSPAFQEVWAPAFGPSRPPLIAL
jgi:N-6 DNA Methylase